jgi:hypothetical protein
LIEANRSPGAPFAGSAPIARIPIAKAAHVNFIIVFMCVLPFMILVLVLRAEVWKFFRDRKIPGAVFIG